MGLVSGRQAAAMLAASGMTTRSARTALSCGLAGVPARTAGALLYDEVRIRQLCAARELAETDLDRAAPLGIFVARRRIDLTAPAGDRVTAAAADWHISPWTWAWIRFTIIDELGFCPFIATTAGHVVLGADLVGVDRARAEGTDARRGRRVDLRLTDPGEWYALLAGTRLRLGPGGTFWLRGMPGQDDRTILEPFGRPRGIVV